MLNINPESRLLVIVAHADDEAIGCGGLLMSHPGPKFVICVTTPGEVRNQREKLTKCFLKSSNIAHFEFSLFLFHDQRLDTVNQIDCNREIEKVIEEFKPDIVVTHSIHDNNLDHQFVHKSVNVAARYIPNLLYFRIPSRGEFAGFNSQVIIPCNANKKSDLLNCYEEEMGKRSRKRIDLDAEYFEVGRLELMGPSNVSLSMQEVWTPPAKNKCY